MRYDLEKFSCTLCGKCCEWKGFVYVTRKDIKAISHFLEMDEEEYIEKFTTLAPSRKGLALIEPENGTCIYYDLESKRCQIYPVRPKQCQDFPWEWQHEECPGLQKVQITEDE